jgi:hypothetical protein
MDRVMRYYWVCWKDLSWVWAKGKWVPRNWRPRRKGRVLNPSQKLVGRYDRDMLSTTSNLLGESRFSLLGRAGTLPHILWWSSQNWCLHEGSKGDLRITAWRVWNDGVRRPCICWPWTNVLGMRDDGRQWEGGMLSQCWWVLREAAIGVLPSTSNLPWISRCLSWRSSCRVRYNYNRRNCWWLLGKSLWEARSMDRGMQCSRLYRACTCWPWTIVLGMRDATRRTEGCMHSQCYWVLREADIGVLPNTTHLLRRSKRMVWGWEE